MKMLQSFTSSGVPISFAVDKIICVMAKMSTRRLDNNTTEEIHATAVHVHGTEDVYVLSEPYNVITKKLEAL